MIGKTFLPKSLFGRALLILVLPTVLIQLVMVYVFFDRHWDDVTRHISNTLAGEIAFFLHEYEKAKPSARADVITDFELFTDISVFFDSPESFHKEKNSDEFSEFQSRLDDRIDEDFTVRKINNGNTIEICIKLPDQTLRLLTTAKKLESRTTTLYLAWMLGTSGLFLMIAIIFLRNQIRPIRKLAEAADSFGRGVDIPNFRPSGANEIRTAARAFIIMRERIKRQLRTRTEMLASISHDLRTPLTRMKLELAMLPDNDTSRELGDDVQQMEHMIQEYLDFARGEGKEEATRTVLNTLLEEVLRDYQRQKADVTLHMDSTVEMDIHTSSFRRMLHNVIDNALRYGKRCDIGMRQIPGYSEIIVDDEGPGIPLEKREEVFKPFSRLDPSRNIKTGGVGLGLTVARDVALAHGGAIILDSSPKGGLRVIIRLPL